MSCSSTGSPCIERLNPKQQCNSYIEIRAGNCRISRPNWIPYPKWIAQACLSQTRTLNIPRCPMTVQQPWSPRSDTETSNNGDAADQIHGARISFIDRSGPRVGYKRETVWAASPGCDRTAALGLGQRSCNLGFYEAPRTLGCRYLTENSCDARIAFACPYNWDSVGPILC